MLNRRPDPDSLAHVEDVLARHLQRFDARRELVVTWQRGSADDDPYGTSALLAEQFPAALPGRRTVAQDLWLCARKNRTISADASGPIGSV